MASARAAALRDRRSSGYSTGDRIRLLAPKNNAIASIAKQAATGELNAMVDRYNAGEVGNDEMRQFLTKMSSNIGLSANDKLEVERQIKDFDSRIIKDRLEANYKAAPDNSLQQMQAAQALSSYYQGRAQSMEPGTPAQSQNLQDAASWGQQVVSIKTSIAKKAAQELRYQEELKVNQLPNNTSERATQKAQMYKTLYDRAVADGDSVGATRYASYHEQQVTLANELSTKEYEKANKEQLGSFINTTINDYHDGKISGEDALQNLQEADKFAYEIGDLAAQNRLNSLSVTINREIEKGVYYTNRNGLSVKSSSGSGSGDGELYLNPDGTLSFGGGGATLGGGGGGNRSMSGSVSTTSTGINPLIKKYFPKEQWATAQAVMLAESGGNVNAKGDDYVINGLHAPSYGLFQIRALPGRPDPSQLTDPEFNVRYAAQMWAQQGWQPWSAYTNGRYRQYMGQAKAPGNGAVVQGDSTASGPKSLSQLEIEYKNGLLEANKALVKGYAVRESDGARIPFSGREYMEVLKIGAKQRLTQLQQIQAGYDQLAAAGYTKVGKKDLKTLRNDNLKLLTQTQAEYNGITSGNLVLSMGTSDFTDEMGNKFTKPQIQFIGKDKLGDMVEVNGIHYKPYERPYILGKDEKAARKLAEEMGLLEEMDRDPLNGNYFVPSKGLDVTDLDGNAITYEYHPTYGYLPVGVGPKTHAVRNQIIKEFKEAQKNGDVTPNSRLLSYAEVANYNGTPIRQLTKAVQDEKTNVIDTVAKAAEPVIDTARKVMLPKRMETAGQEFKPLDVVAPMIPKQNIGLNSEEAQNPTIQPQTGQAFQAQAPARPTQLAAKSPSPVAQMMQKNNIQPIKIAPPPIMQTQNKSALQQQIKVNKQVAKPKETLNPIQFAQQKFLNPIKKFFGW